MGKFAHSAEPRTSWVRHSIFGRGGSIGAILFVFRRTRFLGLAILLGVFAIAATIDLHLHELPLRFVFYAASALFVQYLSIQPNQNS
jgi:hypothetical protein